MAFRLAGRRVIGLDSLWFSPHTGRWNWQHGDLALAEWYRDFGHRLDFDVLHFLEWDILLSEPLERCYASVPPDAVGLTALTPLSDVGEDWVWLRDAERRREWQQLLAEARARWDYDETPHACWGPGPCIPRAFIERYAALPPPAPGPPDASPHDELRLPLFAQVLGFELVDTGLRRGGWRDPEEDRYFNVKAAEIEPDTIDAELSRADGHRAFHPVRRRFRADEYAAAGRRGGS